jgi:hypothetical protein
MDLSKIIAAGLAQPPGGDQRSAGWCDNETVTIHKLYVMDNNISSGVYASQ